MSGKKSSDLSSQTKNISVVISCEYFCQLTIQSCAGQTVSYNWKLIGNKMDQCSCIIHYDFITTSDQLIKVSQASLKTLTESKEIHESLGQENHHEEQCNGIPESLGERSFFYHRECYQKFTFAETILKRNAIKLMIPANVENVFLESMVDLILKTREDFSQSTV